MAKAGVRALDTLENFLTSATAPDEVLSQKSTTNYDYEAIFRFRH